MKLLLLRAQLFKLQRNDYTHVYIERGNFEVKAVNAHHYICYASIVRVSGAKISGLHVQRKSIDQVLEEINSMREFYIGMDQ